MNKTEIINRAKKWFDENNKINSPEDENNKIDSLLSEALMKTKKYLTHVFIYIFFIVSLLHFKVISLVDFYSIDFLISLVFWSMIYIMACYLFKFVKWVIIAVLAYLGFRYFSKNKTILEVIDKIKNFFINPNNNKEK